MERKRGVEKQERVHMLDEQIRYTVPKGSVNCGQSKVRVLKSRRTAQEESKTQGLP